MTFLLTNVAPAANASLLYTITTIEMLNLCATNTTWYVKDVSK